MTEHDWTWQPNSITFKRNYFAFVPEFGKQSHIIGSPYWSFELQLPPKTDDVRRDIDTFLAITEGRDVVNVYDPRVMYPKNFHHLTDAYGVISNESVIPIVTVKSTNRSTSSIVVNGTAGDIITVDDPIAFTDSSGYRHYYRASQTITLHGGDQTLNVTLRPRFTLSSLNIVTTRIRPTQRFLIDINNTGGLTDSDKLTRFTLKGVEFWGTL